MRILSLFAALFLSLVALAPSSHAATVNWTVTFEATDFNHHGADVDGTFNVTFDPTHFYVNNTTAVTDFQITSPTSPALTFTSPIYFSYTPFVGAQIGGKLFSLPGKGTDTFDLIVSVLGNAFTYSQSDLNKVLTSYHVTFQVSQAVTPIPGSVLMLLTALGLLGGVGYVRSRKAQPQAAMSAAA